VSVAFAAVWLTAPRAGPGLPELAPTASTGDAPAGTHARTPPSPFASAPQDEASPPAGTRRDGAIPAHRAASDEPVPPLGSAPAAHSGRLLVPVAGVRPEELVDTYSQARSGGRRHDAIDIPAPRGTRVLAAAGGSVLKLFRSEQGGITLYQLGTDRRTVYYYAHLDRYAPSIAEGMPLRQGETIGYVGDTGNAGAGNYHLHFEVSTTRDPTQYWGGTPANPYPLLVGAGPR
jgi:peptidoglycan LD-endopeptidase LytH